MDYEKKDFRKLYEDLVKSDWFKRAYHNKSLGECPFDIPELKESEDERIRKELKEAFEAYDIESTWNGIPIRSIFAWLEKQKEWKPAVWSEDSVKFEEGFKAGRESGLRDGQKYVLNNLDSYGLCKPAEWSEEDKEMLLSIINAFRNGTVSTIGQEQWLKSLHKRFNLEPKQEWSEEDEEMIQGVIGDLESLKDWIRANDQGWRNNPAFPLINKRIDWLKSLRPSWKPSEQEKGALKTAIYVLTEERNFPKTAEQLQAILDAFDGKEARKDWKPSEEQMNGLAHAINLDVYDAKRYGLDSLYNDLKKL